MANTMRLFKQNRFNLLHEESEGYSKVSQEFFFLGGMYVVLCRVTSARKEGRTDGRGSAPPIYR